MAEPFVIRRGFVDDVASSAVEEEHSEQLDPAFLNCRITFPACEVMKQQFEVNSPFLSDCCLFARFASMIKQEQMQIIGEGLPRLMYLNRLFAWSYCKLDASGRVVASTATLLRSQAD